MRLSTNKASSVLVLFLLTSSFLMADDQARHTIGQAVDLKSNELLYREIHCNIKDNQQTVVYLAASDELIADKTLDFSTRDTTPSFVQYNHLQKQEIKVGYNDGLVSMSTTNFADGNASTTNKDAKVESKDQLVIDAGFDNYVRANWQSLLQGNSLEFRFPLVSRGLLVTLRIAEHSCLTDSETDRCFTLEPANWLIRKLSDPIELSYDSNTRKLKRYRGLSNIEDANGEGMNVTIDYKYNDGTHPLCSSV